MNLTVRPVTVRAGHGPRQIAPQVMHTLGGKWEQQKWLNVSPAVKRAHF